jgi:hypothetical protein
MSNYKMLKKTTEGTEVHGGLVINLAFPPCNSVYSVVNFFHIYLLSVITR